MSQTLILLQEKGLLNEDALDQRIAELETKYHDSLAVMKDLEGRMHPEITKAMEVADAEPNADTPVPMPTADPEQFKTYQVPDEFMRVYKTLSIATEMVKNTWK